MVASAMSLPEAAALVPYRRKFRQKSRGFMIVIRLFVAHVTGYTMRQAQPKSCAGAAGLALGGPTVEGKRMIDTRISRRAALMSAGAVAAWLASPARALLDAVGRLDVPAFIEPLIARMTLEEKAGPLSLMASA